jgi:hypothetical protein
VKSPLAIDLEGSYVSTDHADMRLCVGGRKGDSIAAIDRKAVSRGKRSNFFLQVKGRQSTDSL